MSAVTARNSGRRASKGTRAELEGEIDDSGVSDAWAALRKRLSRRVQQYLEHPNDR